MSDSLLGAILQRFGEEGDGRLHEAPPRLDLPEETFHIVYVDESNLDSEGDGQVRFAQLKKESSRMYREVYSVAVPDWLAKFIAFEAKPEVTQR